MARFCLRCGRRLRRVREDHRLRHRCGACGWTFYGNPVPATAAIVVRGGSVLLVRRGQPPYAGFWDLPGGFLEGGEDPGVGLRRELREELGIKIRRQRLVAVLSDRYGKRGFPTLILVYRAALGPGRLRPADDVTEARWFPASRVPFRAVAFAGIRRALRRELPPRALRGRSRLAPAGSSRA